MMNKHSVEIGNLSENSINENSETQHKKLAMTVAIISWSMLFATLLLGYFVYRFSQTVWPPLGIASIPKLLPNLSLVSVLLSSVTLWYAQIAKEKNKDSNVKTFVFLTLILGVAYMVFQVLFWKELKLLNIFTSTSIFSSMIYAFTWIHAAHMIGALGGMLFFYIKIQQSRQINKWSNYFFNISTFWHFLTIVWMILYLTLFVF